MDDVTPVEELPALTDETELAASTGGDGPSPSPAESRERAVLAARVAADRQGTDAVVLDVGAVLAIVDWFVITSARNTRLVQTIAEEVEAALKLAGGGPLRVEGAADAEWVLLDFGDVVVHVFLDEVRSYYELERLWGDVPRLDWEAEPTPSMAGE